MTSLGIIPENAGCRPHCDVCQADDTEPGERGIGIYGRRWLRPHAELESRDARGVFRFLRSGDPRHASFWGQRRAHFELANVWKQVTRNLYDPSAVRVYEFFEHPDGTPVTICDGGAGINSCLHDGQETGLYGSSTVGVIDAGLVTCWTFHGYGWPPTGAGYGDSPNFFDCTGASSGNDPRQIAMSASSMFNATIVTLGEHEHRYEVNACTSNAAVRCYGHRVPDGGTHCAKPGSYLDDYYNSSPAWTAFDYMYVVNFGARFAGASPETSLKNAAMAFIEANPGVYAFDQLDSPRRGKEPANNLNGSIGYWGRAFNMAGDPELTAWEDLPVVANLTGRTRKSGHAVSGELVVVAAQLEMHLVLQRIRKGNPMDPDDATSHHVNPVYPLIRMECVVHLGIRADVDGFGVQQIVQTWRPPEQQDTPIAIVLQQHVDMAEFINNFPIVMEQYGTEQFDRITWEFEGRPVKVPAQFTWRGHLGHLSTVLEGGHGGPTRDIYAHNATTTPCCRLARGFNSGQHGNGLEVWGLASHTDAAGYGKHQTYIGNVMVKFASGLECDD